jgi:hypothetical protein
MDHRAMKSLVQLRELGWAERSVDRSIDRRREELRIRGDLGGSQTIRSRLPVKNVLLEGKRALAKPL